MADPLIRALHMSSQTSGDAGEPGHVPGFGPLRRCTLTTG